MTQQIPQQMPYLHDIGMDEALAAWHAALAAVGLLQPLEAESVELDAALGRVTAEAVWARISSPHYHASAMDGYALNADASRGASETNPVRLQVDVDALYVDTGDPLPPNTNAVVMIEAVQQAEIAEGAAIEIIAALPPWQHVRAMGEDMVASELVLPSNHRLRPQDLGALAGSGHMTVLVHRRPRVAIIPTGTELVLPGAPLKPGDIIEYNSLVLGAQAQEAGCEVTRYPIHRDDRAVILATVEAALVAHDLVVINAGSSAGSEDFTASIVQELGTLCVHGIAMRPGHPVILGVARSQGPRRARGGVAGDTG